jgi:hypothetical protein
MSGMPIMIAPGATHGDELTGPARSDQQVMSPLAIPMPHAPPSEWSERAQHYAAQAVANAERAQREKVEDRLSKPSRRWTSVEIVRTYQADADGERRFREEADVLGLHGYVGWLETGLAGQPLGARLLVEAGLSAVAHRHWWRVSPKRTVTWVRRMSLAANTVS